ncbi:MAG: glycosyltransferase [Lachnospiraceae bacterium]|nr:glycosyltransferase [Lachnospiraceae bacterium]
MIRVLQYIGSMEQGGSQAMIMNIYRNIDRSQIQFDFVIHAGGMTPLANEAVDLGATIFTCPSFSASSVGNYSKWWKNFFKEHTEYKIVHSHVRSTAAIVLSIAKKNGCITIAHSHSTSSGSGFSAVVKNILQYRIRYTADYFMGCSQQAGEWLFGKKICFSDRYFNVRNAIDAKKYIYDENIAKSTREELGYSDEDFVIGHVGRLSEPKNHTFLIDVFAEVHKKDDKYKLLLVGDGELRTEIEQKIKSLGLENFVQMTGTRSDVNRLMMAMDLFLFPSKWEGLGIVMIEAQATGCPCIASDVVPRETDLTKKNLYLSLDDSSVVWADKIVGTEKKKRENNCSLITGARYDIRASADWVQEFYSNLAK